MCCIFLIGWMHHNLILTAFLFHAYRYSYWDCSYDQALLNNSIALNLLYILTLSDVDRGWIFGDSEAREQLYALQLKGNKKDVSFIYATLLVMFK